MDLTAESIEKLQNSGAPVTLFEDTESMQVAMNGDVRTIIKTVPMRMHRMDTLTGLLDYLASIHAKGDSGVVFVGDSTVTVDLQYQKPGTHTLTLTLGRSDEYNALQSLFAGVSQKQLHNLLLTKLDACIDPALFLQISSIKIGADETIESIIKPSGLTNKSGSSKISMTFSAPKGEGTHTAEIQQKWQWKGRIWEAFDDEFVIDLTLELDSNGPKFTFHPRRLDVVLRTARLALVNELKGKVPDTFTVHEGAY
jgi:hypothetical protein